MALPPCNTRQRPSRPRTIACLGTIVRLHCLRTLNSLSSRDHLKVSLMLPLLNLLFKDIRYRLSIKLARRPCRCLPPTLVECQACLHKANNNTLVLLYSRHGNKDQRR